MKYFLMKPKAKKYECHLHCLQFDHTCIFYLFDRFYLGIGIIKCLMEKRYYMVLQNIFIIIVLFFGLYCIGYFGWVQSAARIVFSIFS